MNDSASPPVHESNTRPTWLGGMTVFALVMLWVLRDIAVLAGLSLMLAYALDPFVDLIQRLRIRGRSLSRNAAAGVVIVLSLFPAGFALVWGLPRLAGEFLTFLDRAPIIVAQILYDLRGWANTHGYAHYVDPVSELLKANQANLPQNATSIVAAGLGRLFGGLGALLGFSVLPILAFYLLGEREQVKTSAFGFVPPAYHGRLTAMTSAVDLALRSYVRGQAIVCLAMGVAVGTVLAVLGFPYSLFLGVVVGLAEIVPYLGFIFAALAIVIVGFTLGPLQALIGLVAYTVVNNLVGLFITPRVMGRYLKMHAYVVTLSVLAGAKLLGPAGVMLALPLAAIVQAVASQFAQKPPTVPDRDAGGGDTIHASTASRSSRRNR